MRYKFPPDLERLVKDQMVIGHYRLKTIYCVMHCVRLTNNGMQCCTKTRWLSKEFAAGWQI